MKLTKNDKKLLTWVAVAAVVWWAMSRKSSMLRMAGIDEAVPATGFWKLPRADDCESSYSDSTGKFVCGVPELISEGRKSPQ